MSPSDDRSSQESIPSMHGAGASDAKRRVGEEAAKLVENGMKLGIGTGSTAAFFVEALGKRVREEGLEVIGVPTSVATGRLAEKARIPLTTLDNAGWLDLTVDGADEIDPDLNLIKGGGGALLIEKIVASASDRMVVIADASKKVATLGKFPLPVEVTPFGWETTRAVLQQMLAEFDVESTQSRLRMNKDEPFITDEGNMIIDLMLGRIGDPGDLAIALNGVPGVVENGLFIDIADAAIIAGADGAIEILNAPHLA